MSPLANKTILLTGASSGIGQATARGLLDRGARVIGVSRRPDSLSQGIIPIKADLTSRDDIQQIFRQIDRIDALVNNAGIAYLSRIIDGNPADWEEMWRVNVFALSLCSQLALRHFPKKGGRIVNISSMSGHRVPPTGGFYAPTKFAVRAISDAMRLEIKASGLPVQVGCVSPGFVDTPLLDHYFRGREEALQKTREAMTMLEPEDVARCVIQLLETPDHVEIGDILLRSAEQKV
ncbi:SDR family oxidoreductase [Haloferula sp. A504]|uniref:SDR family oxidoreductase n=1 Tax=Haloferula sp. A504 TaxID=3373601 RepID=UPI0031CA87B0|nr:SDR family NAD(P)-dependent oxidoreductase [Verrucomicrobiaceae bacterium E54]